VQTRTYLQPVNVGGLGCGPITTSVSATAMVVWDGSSVTGLEPARAGGHAEIERDGVICRGVGSRVYVIVAGPAEQVVLA
jgi:hypothetical protein